MPRLRDVFAEINAVNLWQTRRAEAEGAAASFNPDQVRDMTMAMRMYPDIRPGPLLALAHGKYRYDHPLVQQVGELSAAQELREHPAGTQIGQPGVSVAMRRSRSESQREFNRARTMAEEGAPPVWVDMAKPEVVSLWRTLDDAGLISNGFITDPQSDDGDPNQFVYNEALKGLAAAGVTGVPVLRGEHQKMTAPSAEYPTALRSFTPDDVGMLPGTPEYREAMGQRPGAGPGFLESVQRVASGEGAEHRGQGQMQSPAEQQVAGVAEMAVTTPVRMSFMAMDAPVQEIQGQFANLYGLTHGKNPQFTQTQSDLGMWMGDPSLSSGTGFFVDPESELANARRTRTAERGLIGGHTVTAGRWLANSVGLDPDTKPFQLMSGLTDLSVQLADPTAWALSKGGKLRQASRIFAPAQEAEEAAGLVRGLRNVIRPVDGQHWMDNAGRESIDFLTVTHSPAEVGRALNYKGDVEDWVRIADTRSNAETRAVFEPMLGTSIRRVDDATVGAGRVTDDPLSVMPTRGQTRTAAQKQVFLEIESFLHNAGANPGYGAPILDKVARARTSIEVNAAVRDALRGTDGLLIKEGIEDAGLRQVLTGLHADTHEAIHLTQRAALTNQGPSTVPVMVNGEAVDVLEPVLMSELAPEFLSLPDARAIRRAVSDMPNIFKAGLYTDQFGLRRGAAAVEAIQNQIWKPLQLMRAAWTVRVVGEEQLRMAAAGYDSMFNHPLSYISWGAGRKGHVKPDSVLRHPLQGVNALPGVHPIAALGDAEVTVAGHRILRGRKGQTDIMGEFLAEANQHTDTMATTHAGWVDNAVIPTHVKTTFAKGDPARHEQFMQSWGSEILKLHGDPVARQVADSASLDEAVDWFTRGAGTGFRGQLATAYPGKFKNLEQARGYLEGLQNRIHYFTGGDDDLMDAVRTGRLRGESLLDGANLNAAIRSPLDGKFDDFAPATMLGEDVARESDGPLVSTARWWQDRVVDRLFGILMTNRTNNLSRSRTFKQAYWREAERLVAFGDESAKAQVLQGARDANLGSRAIRRIERVNARGELSADELDFLAKGHGLDETKTLLYDLSRRGRFMDAARVVVPFGEAWKEVLTRWVGTPSARFTDGLLVKNPATIRRFQQGIQGARGEDFGDFMGAPDGEGFFFPDPIRGEQFIIPGTGILTENLLGVEIPLTGSVQGLSMFGTVMPGLGPVVQIPTAWLLKTKPGPQFMREAFSAIETARAPEGIPLVGGSTVREQLLPFGSPSEADASEALNFGNYLPTWARTAINWASNGDGNEQQWGNAVNATAAYLASTGDYDSSQADRQRLMEDAADKARWFMLIKSVAQGFSPSSPSEDWRVLDRNDNSLRVRALAEEYQALQKDDFGEADRVFMDRYGVDVLAAIKSDTAGIEYSIPTTREGVAWVISNPGVTEDLPHTYGFFAPKGGEFDYALYADQFREGQRQQLSLDQWTRLMNTVKGDLQYEDAKLEVGDEAETDEGEDYLSDVRSWITENYDGWGDKTGIPQRTDTEILVSELYDAIENDAVMETDAGRGLALYLEARDQVVGYADSEDMTLGQQDMADGRSYLRDYATWVIGEHPGFKDIYNIVLSREVKEDD